LNHTLNGAWKFVVNASTIQCSFASNAAVLCRPKPDSEAHIVQLANGKLKTNQFKENMFITLTNANPLHRGNPISLKRDLIVSIYTSTQVRDDSTIDQVTFIFLPPHGTWEVLETFDEVMDLVNNG
jgi:hypothetical protein